MSRRHRGVKATPRNTALGESIHLRYPRQRPLHSPGRIVKYEDPDWTDDDSSPSAIKLPPFPLIPHFPALLRKSPLLRETTALPSAKNVSAAAVLSHRRGMSTNEMDGVDDVLNAPVVTEKKPACVLLLLLLSPARMPVTHARSVRAEHPRRGHRRGIYTTRLRRQTGGRRVRSSWSASAREGGNGEGGVRVGR